MSEKFGPINLHFDYHFHPSLIFSSGVGDYQSGALNSLGWVWTILNTLAYLH
jgi:hypothetical protein